MFSLRSLSVVIRGVWVLFGCLFVLLAAAPCESKAQEAQATYNPNNYDALKIVEAFQQNYADLTLLSAHRGIHAIENIDQAQHVPENSLEAIGLAAQDGYEAIEVDVRLTSDGIPVLSHDKTWGREWCYVPYNGTGFFDPFLPLTGNNEDTDPAVTTVALSDTRNLLRTTVLRDTVDLLYDKQNNSTFLGCSLSRQLTGAYPPTLQDVYDYLNNKGIQAVLMIDVQSPQAATAAWNVTSSNRDTNGRNRLQTTIFKLPAAMLKNGPQDFIYIFGTSGGNNYPLWIPVITTSLIAPPAAPEDDELVGVDVVADAPVGFGGEPQINSWLDTMNSNGNNAGKMVGVEVVMKENGGILSSVLAHVGSMQNDEAKPMTIGNFNPVGEYYPYGPTQEPEYFRSSNGTCCDLLEKYLYNNPNSALGNFDPGGPQDNSDNRRSFPFIFRSGVPYTNFVTTDDPMHAAVYLGPSRRNWRGHIVADNVSVASNAVTLSLHAGQSTANVGDTVHLLALLSDPFATGTVTFMDGATTLGTVALSTQNASFDVTESSAGMHIYTASYSGDQTYSSTASNSFTISVSSSTGGTGGGNAASLRLLPLGDSITWGQTDPTGDGYRYSLFTQLASQGYSVDFVGTQRNGQFSDNYNEGHPGWRIDQIAGIADGVLAKWQPNVVTLMIGTNDCDQSYNVSTAPSRLSSLISQIYADDPNAAIALATLLPLANSSWEPCVQLMNSQIPNIVSQFQSQGKHIVVADTSAVTVDELVDGIHPNSTGYQQIAGAYLAAINQMISNGWIQNAPPCNTIPATCNDPALGGTGTVPVTHTGLPQPRQPANGWIDAGSIASGSDIPGEVRYVDMDGDGKADFVIVAQNTGGLTVFLNKGTDSLAVGGGSWAGPIEFATGNAPGNQVVLADINGDGKADYLVVDPTTGAVRAWLNNGGDQGGGWTYLGQIAAGEGALGTNVRFADVNGDGKADYLVIDPNTGAVDAWLNRGTDAPALGGGGWYALGRVATGDGPGGLVRFADINGDGFADYLLVNPITGSVNAWLNNGMDGVGAGWIALGQIAAGTGQGPLVQFADINGDGIADYLIVSKNTGQTNAWLNNGGDATPFPQVLPSSRPIQPRPPSNGWTAVGSIATGVSVAGEVRYADMNGDGRADFVVVNSQTGGLTVLLNSPYSGWSAPIEFALGDAPAAQVILADINGDGKADYLVVDPITGAVRAWLNNGGDQGGGWIPLGQIAAGEGGPGANVRFADVNGDGLADYLVVDPASGSVNAWLNAGMDIPGGGGWRSVGSIISGHGPGGMVQFADINGDGWADYLLVNPATGAVTAWLNNGTDALGGGWTSLGQIAAGTGKGSPVQFADVNGDGKADYLIVLPSQGATNGQTTALLNNGGDPTAYPPVLPPSRALSGIQNAGSWTSIGSISAGTYVPGSVYYVDMNGDGFADYVVVDTASGGLTVWLNAGEDAAGQIVWSGPIKYTTGFAPAPQVFLADINGDGRADYIVVDPNTGAVRAWLNKGGDQGHGWGYLGQIAQGAGAGLNVAFADVNGDGLADYLVIDPTTGAVSAWLNAGMDIAGGRGWASIGQISAGHGSGAVQFADINGDGWADYLQVNPQNGSVYAWLNTNAPGGGGWTPLGQIATGTGSGSSQGFFVQFADINGDGLADYLQVQQEASAPPYGQTNAWINTTGGQNTTKNTGGGQNTSKNP